MFGIVAGLLIALFFAARGLRVALNVRGAATAMARHHGEALARQAPAEGVLTTSRFAWPAALFRCIGALAAPAGTAAAPFAVAVLITTA
ncbi:hypothetical protein [Streptomyces sp. NPDC019224]|uniref:hypothetical protein n=1 Tax=Streptomyces sp. NPDC019224 TaxID=3154484 RepID=UPI0033F96A4F